jgi:tetratricopeptide (TPR) repeat protein
MILLFAVALASAAPSGTCPDAATPQAFVCHALEARKSGDVEAAAAAFDQAAKASPANDPAAARMYAAAGNMWIAAGQPGKAALSLDRALGLPGLEAEQRGEALLDRARAAEAQNDLATARKKLNEAAATVSDDPFYWYFSASLAIGEQDKATAEAAIAKALTLAPSDPSILFEAGHVAHFTGDDVGARHYWSRAAAGDPNGPAGKAAREALKLLPAPLTVKNN